MTRRRDGTVPSTILPVFQPNAATVRTNTRSSDHHVLGKAYALIAIIQDHGMASVVPEYVMHFPSRPAMSGVKLFHAECLICYVPVLPSYTTTPLGLSYPRRPCMIPD